MKIVCPRAKTLIIIIHTQVFAELLDSRYRGNTMIPLLNGQSLFYG